MCHDANNQNTKMTLFERLDSINTKHLLENEKGMGEKNLGGKSTNA